MLKKLRKTAGALALGVLAPTVAFASPAGTTIDFTGAYAPASWTTSTNGGTGSFSTSPSSVTITGSDGGTGHSLDTMFTHAVTKASNISFNWSYTNSDRDINWSWDPAYFINGSNSVALGNNASSGNYSASVAAGDWFGWNVHTVDDILGSGHLTISNFSAAVSAPEIDGGKLPLVLLLLGMLYLVSQRKRMGFTKTADAQPA